MKEAETIGGRQEAMSLQELMDQCASQSLSANGVGFVVRYRSRPSVKGLDVYAVRVPVGYIQTTDKLSCATVFGSQDDAIDYALQRPVVNMQNMPAEVVMVRAVTPPVTQYTLGGTI